MPLHHQITSGRQNAYQSQEQMPAGKNLENSYRNNINVHSGMQDIHMISPSPNEQIAAAINANNSISVENELN